MGDLCNTPRREGALMCARQSRGRWRGGLKRRRGAAAASRPMFVERGSAVLMSSCCLAPPRMEAFTMRLCLNALQQYQRLIDRKTGDLSSIWNQKSSAASGFRRWRRSAKETGLSDDDDRKLLKFLAINALDLTAPASDVLLKNRQNTWFQLSGHPDCFAPAGPGTIWKKRNHDPDNAEREVYEALGADPEMADVVPQYFREVLYKGESFIELQDLLHGFVDPHVIDIKMGTRTFLESEVCKTAARHDLYTKMVAVDPNAPTAEEHALKAVTKLRYMQFREEQSSTCSQGFRIEAMKCRGSPPFSDLKTVKSRAEVLDALAQFLSGRDDVREKLVRRLNKIRAKFEKSDYFKKHEVVGSSIFMIFDDTKVGAWIIDFAKTHPVPDGVCVNHRDAWVQGNHEEGFLFGLDSLISAMEEVNLQQSLPVASCQSGIPSIAVNS